MTTILALAALAQSPEIGSYVQPGFRDAAFTAKIVQKDLGELEKISHDFGQSFRLDDLSVRIKEPYKVRADAKVEDTGLSLVVNGLVRSYRVPRLRLNTKQDLSKRPGNRQTVMDFGLLTPSLFVDFLDAKFVSADAATGDAVFDLTYKPVFEDATRFRVWLDPKTRTLVKREWYHRTGRLMATFAFEAPKTENGASMPTRVTVTNAEGRVAGVTRYDGVRMNQGIADDVFAI